MPVVVRSVGDGSVAWFRPTPRQAAGRGLWLGLVASAVLLTVVAAVVLTPGVVLPSGTAWVVLAVAPPILGVVVALVLRRGDAVRVDAAGIRPGAGTRPSPWAEVADLRAERHGSCTVVQLYLGSGLVVRLPAPYHGVWLGADPHFERKLFALVHLWRSHRIGGPVG